MAKSNNKNRTIERIKRLYEINNKPKTHTEIYEGLLSQKQLNTNRPYTNSPTRNELSNILSKFKDFVFVDNEGVTEGMSNTYKTSRWKLRGEYDE